MRLIISAMRVVLSDVSNISLLNGLYIECISYVSYMISEEQFDNSNIRRNQIINDIVRFKAYCKP